ncbi:MAG: sigma 54-interacting transcriptional regulator, partial [Bacillota bacterium]
EWKALQRLAQRMAGAEAKFTFVDLVGADPHFRAAVELARRAAATSATVLLEGETGTGKELFAQAIHNASRRAMGPFVAVNCGVIPRELVASELFGYVEGAFTGARRGGRPGKFELADGGTLFLDEVSEMSLEMQVGLLRVLQERKVVRVGGDRVIPVDVRVIAATNRDLRAEVERGRFRQDLYFRLNVFHIRVPALRHRRGDIPLLVNYFLERYCRAYGRRVPGLHPEVVAALQAYPWPGNVRELQNVVERLVLTVDNGDVSPAHLPPDVTGSASQFPAPRRKRGRLRELQHAEIMRVLAECGGNVSRAASELGVARSTIYRRLARSG